MTFGVLQLLCIFWLAAEICLTRRSGAGPVSKDRGSVRIIWLTEMASIALGVLAAFRFHQFFLHPWMRYHVLGICILAAGITLRLYAILYLGRFFTINVAIATDHRVIDSGPYRFIRHPSYTGALLGIFGLGLGIGNWLSLIIIFVPIFLVLC